MICLFFIHPYFLQNRFFYIYFFSNSHEKVHPCSAPVNPKPISFIVCFVSCMFCEKMNKLFYPFDALLTHKHTHTTPAMIVFPPSTMIEVNIIKMTALGDHKFYRRRFCHDQSPAIPYSFPGRLWCDHQNGFPVCWIRLNTPCTDN